MVSKSTDHLKNGVVTYSGNYKDTGDPLHITQIRLNERNSKSKCTLKCHSAQENGCLSQGLSDVGDAIKRKIEELSNLKHEHLLDYKSAIISDDFIYIIRDVDKKSTSANTISKTTKWTCEAVGKVITSVVKALQYLHQNDIAHGYLRSSSIFVNEQNVWKVADYFLVPYINHLSQKNNTSCFVRNKKADLKSIGKLIESFDIQSQPLNEFVKLCKTSNHIGTIINDPLFAKISKFSRLESEFQVMCYLGEGAFGDVLKVTSYTDNKDYAIKRVKLFSKTCREFKRVKKEAQALSKLKHPNIVQYYTSWTEIDDESVFNSYKPFNNDSMDVE